MPRALLSEAARLDTLIDQHGAALRTWRDTVLARLDALTQDLDQARQDAMPVVLAMAEMLEGRDNTTYGHSRKVAMVSSGIAEAMGWSPERTRLLRMAGLLHDIGKIIIPDAILHKEGKYTEFEFETMKLHSSTGGRILHRLGMLGAEAELWVLHHQERWDGTGYPDGLTGTEIPMGARIMALADAYEAMTSYRRYRQALPHWVVLDELGHVAGKQFDPDVVRVFQEHFPQPITFD